MISFVFQVWCTSLCLERTLYLEPLREHTYLQWTMAATTLALLSTLASNTSPDQMASLWTGWAGEFFQTIHDLNICSLETNTENLIRKQILWIICASPLYRNLYWADSRVRRLEVAMLDGRYRKHIVKTELGHPSAVAVNPRLGWDRHLISENHVKDCSWFSSQWSLSNFIFPNLTLHWFS